MPEPLTRGQVANMIATELHRTGVSTSRNIEARLSRLHAELIALRDTELPKLRDAILALNGDVNDLETSMGALEHVVQSRTEHLA